MVARRTLAVACGIPGTGRDKPVPYGAHPAPAGTVGATLAVARIGYAGWHGRGTGQARPLRRPALAGWLRSSSPSGAPRPAAVEKFAEVGRQRQQKQQRPKAGHHVRQLALVSGEPVADGAPTAACRRRWLGGRRRCAPPGRSRSKDLTGSTWVSLAMSEAGGRAIRCTGRLAAADTSTRAPSSGARTIVASNSPGAFSLNSTGNPNALPSASTNLPLGKSSVS